MVQGSKWANRLSAATDLYDEVMPGQPLVELVSDCRVLVENHMGVTEYGDNVIQVKVKFGCVCIYGANLELAVMTREQLVITGSIESIKLVRRGH